MLHNNFLQEGKLFTGPAARHMIGAPGIGIPNPGPEFKYKVFIQNRSRGSRCLIKGSVLYYKKRCNSIITKINGDDFFYVE
jgi:hypothetical protein